MSRVLLVVSLTAIYIGWVLTVKSCYDCFAGEGYGEQPCEVEIDNTTSCRDEDAQACFAVSYDFMGNMTYERGCSDLKKDMICEYYRNISAYTVKQCSACDQDNCNDDKFEM